MATEDFKRKLTAIFSADVAGYSRLMGENEAAAVKCLEQYKGVMFTLIKQHRGRVIDSPGDNLLAEFGSVVDAVQCAVAVQKELQARNSDLPDNRRMQFRIGINLGDVIEEQGRIYGDGVNIAARIESLADPGGICISKTAFDYIENKLPFGYRFIGRRTVKNISKPVAAYKVLMDPRVIDDVEEEDSKFETHRKPKHLLQDKPSIAVLPFVNMSNDPEQEYFSDGMTEELIGALAKLEGLRVISRTSVFYTKGKDLDLHTLGKKLNVENVLEGSVRKAGNKLRISAQLIEVAEDTHLWSENYDRELQDVFAVQDEISQAIVKNLKVKLLGMKAEPLVKDYTKNTEAYELYLKGRYYFNTKAFTEWGKAIDYCESAIKVDPQFAPAYSKLAMVHYGYSIQFSLPSNEMWPKIRTLALKALEIDEMDSDAHASMGKIKSFFEYDWPGAEISFKRAIELNPGNSEVHFHYATYLIGVGRTDEAIKKLQLTLELDPFSIIYNGFLGAAFYFERQFDKAIDQSQKTLELAPNDPLALQMLAASYAEKGMYDEGIAILQKVKDIPIDQMFLGYIYGKAEKKKEAQKILDEFLERSEKGYFAPLMIATLYVALGEKDKVFEWLEKSVEEHDAVNWCIKLNPVFDDLHSDPRWKKLMEKMGLAD